jgi:hypothetical protein
MSGAYKYRCLGITAIGGRCRRRLQEEYSYCPIHADQRIETLEVERDTALELFECFKDGDSSQRICGHSCGLSLDKCCECTDKRDGETVPVRRRADGYCTICKQRYVARLPPVAEPAARIRQRLFQLRNMVVFEIDGADEVDILQEFIENMRHFRDG